MTELDIARKVRDGILPSPQKVRNLWLFDVRITGTGFSYRPSLDEHVYRDPDAFLSPDFLERCQGLPIIIDHPDAQVMSPDDFLDRVVGAIMLTYRKDDEVWGIARIYDPFAASLMTQVYRSTSPAVVYAQGDDIAEIREGDIKTSVEGSPSYVDHLAICINGVWDKGDVPSGVSLD